MPNTASAKKDLRQTAKRTERNKLAKRNMEHAIKITRKAAKAGSKDEAAKAFHLAGKLIDKAAQKNIIKPNNAARKKSRLAKLVNAIK